MTSKQQRRKQKRDDRQRLKEEKQRYIDLAKGITNALLNGNAQTIRIAAEGLARVVFFDVKRVKKLAHNALLLSMAFVAIVNQLEGLENEVNTDTLPNGNPQVV